MDSQSNPWRNPKGSQIAPLNHQQNLTYPHKNLANSHKNLNNSRKWAKRGAPACFCHLKFCHQSNSHFCPRLCWESSLTAVSNCEARFNVYRLEKEGEQHLSICATGVLFQDGTLTPSILSDRASEFAPGSRSFVLVLWCTRGKNMTRLQIRLRLLLKIP